MSFIDWNKFFQDFHDNPNEFVVDINKLFPSDSMAPDRQMGICPIPLYEFTDKDWDEFRNNREVEDVIYKLKKMGVYQFFFPAPDQLAISLVDRGMGVADAAFSAIEATPNFGHPFGEMEVLPKGTDLISILPLLKELGYVVEGDIGITVSPSGKELRGNIKFRPRESLISRLASILKLNINFPT